MAAAVTTRDTILLPELPVTVTLVTHIQRPGSNSDWFGPFMFDSIIARQNAQVTPKSMGAYKKNIDCGQNGGS